MSIQFKTRCRVNRDAAAASSLKANRMFSIVQCNRIAKQVRRQTGLLMLSTLAMLAFLPHAFAQSSPPPSGGTYVMTQQVIAGGGARASGGSYVLVGTVGQSEARSSINGGPYVLHSGFHTPRAPSAPLPDDVFKNGFEN